MSDLLCSGLRLEGYKSHERPILQSSTLKSLRCLLESANSTHALSQSFTIAGYLAPHLSAMSSNAALAAFALAAV